MIPKKLRYFSFVRRVGNSLFIHVPGMVKDHMQLKSHENISLVYDTKLKKLTVRKVR